MDGVTVGAAAARTGWSPRMLRYIERAGLIVPPRSGALYRLYGAAELQRLRTLHELLEHFGIALSEVGFARRLRENRELSEAVDGWLEAPAARPEEVPASDWLRWEQEKHKKLLTPHLETV